jgi:hypothetical protein
MGLALVDRTSIVGYNWLDSGLNKVGEPAWIETGAALSSTLYISELIADSRKKVLDLWSRE